MFKRITVAAALTALASTGAAAQMGGMMGQVPDSVPSMQMGRGMMMGGMMGGGMMGSGMMPMMGQGMGMMATGGPGPVTLLRMRDALELTDEQVSRLESIQAEFEEGTQSHRTGMMASHAAAAEALQGDSPDLDAYQVSLQSAANLMVQLHVAMARAALEAREVLTPDQRQQLDTRGPEMMRGMMGAYGWRGMMQNRR